ncbi:MAG: hypothetical protein IPM96_20320 [Ignavibacteria bacterium]|nr:hypothetical protein [Ignavibacteria bacterium]
MDYGPLLVDDSIKFIKGFYKRPKGDSRVTEILVRPFLNFFFPKTKNIIQPLSGEYGGYRKFLEKIYFYSGYSVEVTILLQALYTLNVNEIAQVNLGKRIHPLQSVNSLGQMGAAILKTLLLIAEEFGIVNIRKTPANILRQFEMVKETPKPNDIIITDYRLSPIITLKSYRKKFKSMI